jgi:hypothetical protein
MARGQATDAFLASFRQGVSIGSDAYESMQRRRAQEIQNIAEQARFDAVQKAAQDRWQQDFNQQKINAADTKAYRDAETTQRKNELGLRAMEGVADRVGAAARFGRDTYDRWADNSRADRELNMREADRNEIRKEREGKVAAQGKLAEGLRSNLSPNEIKALSVPAGEFGSVNGTYGQVSPAEERARQNDELRRTRMGILAQQDAAEQVIKMHHQNWGQIESLGPERAALIAGPSKNAYLTSKANAEKAAARYQELANQLGALTPQPQQQQAPVGAPMRAAPQQAMPGAPVQQAPIQPGEGSRVQKMVNGQVATFERRQGKWVQVQ